jgi:hypothetical protein
MRIIFPISLKGLCHDIFDRWFFRFIFAEKFDIEIPDFVVSGAYATTNRWWAVSMTPLTSGGLCQ